jgi:hypothetical protein
MAEVEEISYLELEGGPGVLELPEGPPPAPEGEAPEPIAVLPGWEQSQIEAFLKGTGAGIHMLAGKGERDWLMTEEDLERIAPPLTRICNRYEPTLRLSPIADPLLVAHGFALYGWRSALEARRAQRDAEQAREEQSGYERGPAGADDQPAEDIDQPRYFDEGDSHA